MGIASLVSSLVARWWVILLVGLLGAVVAYNIVVDTNEAQEPAFKAEAIVFASPPQGDGRDVDEEIADQHAASLELAQSVNESALRQESNSIADNPVDGSISFISVQRTEGEAAAEAEEMRAAYVAVDPNLGTEAQLAENFAEAAILEDRLDELTPTTTVPEVVPEDDAAREAQIAILEARIASIQAELSVLTADLLDTTDEDELAELEEELDELEASLVPLYLELAPLQEESEPIEEEPVEPDIPLTDQWTIQAITERLTELQTDSSTMIVNGITDTEVELPEVEVIDETPEPLSLPLWLLSGLVAGGLLAAAIVIIRDRSRKTIWHAKEVGGVRVLAEGPREAESAPGTVSAQRRRRRKMIQTIRSAIVSSLSGLDEGSVVGFVGPPSTSSLALKDLSYEVSASMAWIGRTVLILDVGFASETVDDDLTTRGGLGLTRLVGNVSDEGTLIEERVESVLKGASSVLPGLDILYADVDRVDPVDLLDGKPFRRLLQRAVDMYDVVILVSPPADIASATRITSSLQQQVIVATRGKTTEGEIEEAAILGSPTGLRLRGVVLLDRRMGPLRRGLAKLGGGVESTRGQSRIGQWLGNAGRWVKSGLAAGDDDAGRHAADAGTDGPSGTDQGTGSASSAGGVSGNGYGSRGDGAETGAARGGVVTSQGQSSSDDTD